MRKQRGGEGCLEKYKGNFEQLKAVLEKPGPLASPLLSWLINDDLDIKACSEKYLPGLKDKLLTKKIGIPGKGERNFEYNTLQQIFGGKKIPDSFLNFFDFVEQRHCTVQELMEGENKACTDASKKVVEGSCGEPSFFEDHTEMSAHVKDKYIELLNLIETKLLAEAEPRYFDLVIGSTNKRSSAFSNTNNSYTLCITPITPFINKLDDEFIGTITSLTSLKGEKHEVNASFPLAYARKPNNTVILDKVASMLDKGIAVRLTNKVCGSCFPAFYYLVKKGVQYKVDPEQKIDHRNTPKIQACFK